MQRQNRTQFESMLAKEMIEEILRNHKIKSVLIDIAEELQSQVLAHAYSDVIKKDQQTQELSAAMKTVLQSWAIQHSKGDAFIGALLPHHSLEELRDTLSGRTLLLNAMKHSLSAKNIEMFDTFHGVMAFIKTIDSLGYYYVSDAFPKTDFSQFELIKSMLFPTSAEAKMRCQRHETMAAITYGIGTELNKDLIAPNEQTASCYSGKARLFIPPANHGKNPTPWFQKLAREKDTEQALPLIGGLSFSTSRALITLLHLGAFNKAGGKFDLEKAQIVANCLMGYFVFCGHHSFVETMEIWNRLLDYVAIYHPERLPEGTFPALASEQPYMENPSVEQTLPYGRVGEYRYFLNENYADIVLERARMESQNNNDWLSLEKHQHSTKLFSIIGMGFTGTGLFCHLVEKLIALQKENSSIHYAIMSFDKSAELFGAGLPYQLNSPNTWLLNTPASKFKLMANGIDLASWMQANKPCWENLFPDVNEEYLPRALAGLYLKSQYQLYKEKARLHGITVYECYDEVINMRSTENKLWELTTKNANQYEVDFSFLCFGHLPSNHYAHLESKPNYFHAVFNVEKLKAIPKTATVSILGGQASFVDIALWLAFENFHTGKIITVTRNSPIITSKSKKQECEDKGSLEKLKNNLNTNYLPNSLSLSKGKLLFWDAYQAAAKHPVDFFNLPSTKSALSYQWKKYIGEPVVDEQIGNIDELRSFIFTFYFSGCYAAFWDKLKEEDKVEFNNQLYSHIFAFLTGIPPVNARLLLDLHERGQIQEKSGLTKATYNSETNKFILHFTNGDVQETEYLIDSTGIGYDISKCNFPLVQNLVKNGLLVTKKWGGISLNDNFQPHDAQGMLQENVFCIGPTASYGYKYPTPYASFIAIEAIEKALNAPTFEAQLLNKMGSTVVFNL